METASPTQPLNPFGGIIGIAIALAMCAVVGPLAVIAQAPKPNAEDPLLVISRSPEAVVLAAGGALIGPSQNRFSALAYGDAGFLTRLRHAGAWFVADARWIAEFCGVRLQ